MMKHVVSTAALALLIALHAAPIGAAGPASAEGVGAARPATIVDAAKAGNIEAVRTFLKQPKAATVASKYGTTLEACIANKFAIAREREYAYDPSVGYMKHVE